MELWYKTDAVTVAQPSMENKQRLPRDTNFLRNRTMMDFNSVQERSQSMPLTTQSLTTEALRTQSEMEEIPVKKYTQIKVPVLRPTRQQTEMYLFRIARQKLEKLEKLRQAVIPIDGPTKQLGGNLIPGDIAVFEDQDANAVLLEAESQLKSGYPTIATSSMVARRNGIALEEVDNATDIRFFSDLVKPMQYRWKFQKEKLKTITPSKHGFHQRSQSPTFQRLVQANEKLQYIASHDADVDNNVTFRDFFDTQSEILPVKPSSILRYVKSDQASTRTSYTSSIPATNDTPLHKDYELKPEVRTIEPAKKAKEYYFVQNSVAVAEEKRSPSPIYESPPPTPPPPPKPAKKLQQEFKVDFKKLDSHSELHLFLPHIQDGNSRGATPEEPNRKGKLGLSLPAIEDLEIRTPDEDKSKSKKKYKTDHKKKKKHLNRVKSGIEEKEIKDILNDIPTLISLETDKDFHPESMCMFENCKLHRHRKSNRIRQA